MSKDSMDEAGCKALKDMLCDAAKDIKRSLDRGQPFLVGTMPCTGDFAVYGFLGSMLCHNKANKHHAQVEPIF